LVTEISVTAVGAVVAANNYRAVIGYLKVAKVPGIAAIDFKIVFILIRSIIGSGKIITISGAPVLIGARTVKRYLKALRRAIAFIGVQRNLIKSSGVRDIGGCDTNSIIRIVGGMRGLRFGNKRSEEKRGEGKLYSRYDIYLLSHLFLIGYCM